MLVHCDSKGQFTYSRPLVVLYSVLSHLTLEIDDVVDFQGGFETFIIKFNDLSF